jgi:hypothetical protein
MAGASERELMLAFVAVHYGDELTDQFISESTNQSVTRAPSV